ncbi:isochorismatase family cysteine hydrolase [Streptomyces plumbiresistens]|uniref:Cysteine hydrolase n=1 Tax=Streptomyces plumbiresistens TaxID=511811 RepID=A0ABP7SK85_9ACTN
MNKTFYTDRSIANSMDPKRTALIIVDMQNDFGHPDGYLGKMGQDVSAVLGTVPTLVDLVEAARQAGVLVVWTKNEALPAGRSDSPAWLAFKGTAFELDAPTYTLKDSWGQKFLEPLEPREDEPVVVKYRSSAFDHTALDLILRANGIETVVVCGCATDACVESTARSAAYHDYYTQVASDCVASTRPQMHEDAMRVFELFFTTADSKEFASSWLKDRDVATSTD